MIDAASSTGKGLLAEVDSNSVESESGGELTKNRPKKSGLAINLGQKFPKKSSKGEAVADKKRSANSRLNLEKGHKEKNIGQELEVGATPAASNKKKTGGISISSKTRKRKKPEKEQPLNGKAAAAKPPLPPVVSNNVEPKQPPAVQSTSTAKSPIPPVAKEESPPGPGKVDEVGKATPPPVVSNLSKKLLDSAAQEEKSAPGKTPKSDGVPPPAKKPPGLPPPAQDSAGKKAEEGKAKAEPKPKIIPSTGEPESLLSLLEPDPEEVTKLKQGTKQDRFLSQSVVLEESGLSTLVRSSVLLVALVMASFFIWASYSTIDEMASTTGEIIPNSPIQVIQHLEGGIIEKIFVQEGQIVKKGGMLVRLSAEAALADLNQMRVRLASLMAQKARLVSLIENKEPDFSNIPEEYGVIIQGQLKLLSAQRNAYNGQIYVQKARIDRAESSLDNILDQQEALQRQIAYSEQELQVRKLGYEKGLMSRLMVIAAHRDQVRVESELVRVIGEIVGARKDLNEAVSELEGVIDSTREVNLRELGVITADYSQVVEGITRLEDRVSRLDIYSPAWGIVKSLQMKTIGGVLGPGSVITEIIPLDATRRVETRISTKDVGHVRVGQGVTVKISTFDFARYGGINGILESISPTTFEDPAGGDPYYQGIVRLEKSHVGGNPKVNQVLPGMVVQADIHTGAKTLMEYLLKPIYASVNKSFRER
jgi:membrane fusion protein, adhesin transport system